MICSFFKFSTMEHFYGSKSIAWVDFRVVLMLYSFQGVRVDLEENLKNEQNMPKSENIRNLCYLTLTYYISGKIVPHPYKSYIFWKRLDLLFYLVNSNLVF